MAIENWQIKKLHSLRAKLGIVDHSIPGSTDALCTEMKQLEIDWSKVKQQQECDKMDAYDAFNKLSGRDQKDPYWCRNPKCKDVASGPNAYCDKCKEEVKAGRLKSRRRPPVYKRRVCVTHNCDSVIHNSSENKCSKCKQQEKETPEMGAKKTSGKKKQKLMRTPEMKKAILDRVVELRESGQNLMPAIKKACEEIGTKPIGQSLYHRWVKLHKAVKDRKSGTSDVSAPSKNSHVTQDDKVNFVCEINALIAEFQVTAKEAIEDHQKNSESPTYSVAQFYNWKSAMKKGKIGTAPAASEESGEETETVTSSEPVTSRESYSSMDMMSEKAVWEFIGNSNVGILVKMQEVMDNRKAMLLEELSSKRDKLNDEIRLLN